MFFEKIAHCCLVDQHLATPHNLPLQYWDRSSLEDHGRGRVHDLYAARNLAEARSGSSLMGLLLVEQERRNCDISQRDGNKNDDSSVE